uniref:Uncharacterized protein n=1 Tax=Arundo donax TaxID=35708 RepID=A0A0A9GK04_ARUDO
MFSGAGAVQQTHLRGPPPNQMFHAQPKPAEGAMTPQPPAPRPKVRARRGQATDPHSIAERVTAEKFTYAIKTVAI